MRPYIFSILTGTTIGFIGGAYFWLKAGDPFIQAVIVGSILGTGLSVLCLILERWSPFKTKCDECGSTNLRPWDYDRDTCLDCGAAVPSYTAKNEEYERTRSNGCGSDQ